MKQVLSLSSKIRSVGNTFLAKKLKEYNFNNLVPSHGDILYVLYNHKKLTMKDIDHKLSHEIVNTHPIRNELVSHQ